MARPRTSRTGDLDLILRHMVPVAELRFESLRAFAKEALSPEWLEASKRDDSFFATVLSQAFSNYGVHQLELGKRLDDPTAGKLGRWARMENIPHPLIRAAVVTEIGRMLSEHVERELARKGVNDASSIPTILKGAWAP